MCVRLARAVTFLDYDNSETETFSSHSAAMLHPEHAEKDDLNAEHGTKSIVALLAGLPFPAALLAAPLQSSPEKNTEAFK